MKTNLTRRQFLATTSVAGAGLSLALPSRVSASGYNDAADAAETVTKPSTTTPGSRSGLSVAQIGLDSMYWPMVWGDALRQPVGTVPTASSRAPHRMVACCDLGVTPQDVAIEIGLTPAEYAARFGIKLFPTVEELLDQERIQAAVVSTRNTRMAEVAGRLLERGVPCYLAKPIAASPAAALKLAQKADLTGIPGTAGIATRCFSHYQAVNRAVQSGRIGRVVSVTVMHQHGSFAAWPAKTWYRDPEEGGVPYWLGWYPLETVRWMTGSPIAAISASGVNVTNTVPGEHEVIAASGTTQNGACWSCRIYFAAGSKWKLPMHEVEVLGDHGLVRTLSENRIQVFDDAGAHEETVDSVAGDPVRRELFDWLDTIADKTAWLPTLKELVHTVNACEALRRALRTGQVVRI